MSFSATRAGNGKFFFEKRLVSAPSAPSTRSTAANRFARLLQERIPSLALTCPTWISLIALSN
jgi:hypothetical protein